MKCGEVASRRAASWRTSPTKRVPTWPGGHSVCAAAIGPTTYPYLKVVVKNPTAATPSTYR
eukprot:8263140-Pyramimonas_sp.AAC.1